MIEPLSYEQKVKQVYPHSQCMQFSTDFGEIGYQIYNESLSIGIAYDLDMAWMCAYEYIEWEEMNANK